MPKCHVMYCQVFLTGLVCKLHYVPWNQLVRVNFPYNHFVDVRVMDQSFLFLWQLLDDVCERMRDKKVCFLNHKGFDKVLLTRVCTLIHLVLYKVNIWFQHVFSCCFYMYIYFLFMNSGMSGEKQWCVSGNCTRKWQQGQYSEDFTCVMFLEVVNFILLPRAGNSYSRSYCSCKPRE